MPAVKAAKVNSPTVPKGLDRKSLGVSALEQLKG